ncbi:MAG: hypothetical protein HeimC2_00020 [Candidatus Heimdallarchaeota archaeon LC_2]|nr:MAG: hypothetical protein HeimC2_00020 [Candidatus Heimdallarchaeota archaeon LC_2]
MSRKKLISISIIAFLIFSSGLTYIIYQLSVDNNIDALENANFSIDNIDIITASISEITLQFRLNVTNYDSSSGPSFVKADNIDITLFNNSLEIAKFSVPIESGDFEKSQIITTDLPVKQDEENELLNGLIDNILSGDNFELDFHGRINFHASILLSDSLEFSNKILFVVNSTSLGLEIIDIQIPNINSSFANAEIKIKSPFTTSFYIRGDIRTVISNFDLGNIVIETRLEILSGSHNYVLLWDLKNSPQETIREILVRFNSSITLFTNLVLSINDFQIDTSPELKLSFGDELFSLNILEITNFTTNTAEATFTLELVIELVSNIPMTLNITSITLNITTISEKKIGTLNWFSQIPISIETHSTSEISNVTVVFKELAASTVFELIITQAIKIPSIIIHIQFFAEEIDLVFSLSQIDF